MIILAFLILFYFFYSVHVSRRLHWSIQNWNFISWKNVTYWIHRFHRKMSHSPSTLFCLDCELKLIGISGCSDLKNCETERNNHNKMHFNFFQKWTNIVYYCLNINNFHNIIVFSIQKYAIKIKWVYFDLQSASVDKLVSWLGKTYLIQSYSPVPRMRCTWSNMWHQFSNPIWIY